MSLTVKTGTTTNPNIQGLVDNNDLVKNAATGTLAFGISAASFNTTGRSNTYFGNFAALNTRDGDYNTVFGFLTGRDMGGNANLYMGLGASANAYSSDSNLVMGTLAGYSMQKGGANVILGMSADVIPGVSGGSVADTATGVVCVGTNAVAGASKSTAVGFRAIAEGIDTLALGAQASARGDGSFNIANRLRGFYAYGTSNDTYSVQVDADALRLNGTSVAFCANGVTTDAQSNVGRPRWVASLQRVGSRTGAHTDRVYADLVFRSANHTVVRFTDDFQQGVLNFTGQHRCALDFDDDGREGGPWSEVRENESAFAGLLRPGYVMVATGKYMDLRGRTGIPDVSLDCGGKSKKSRGGVDEFVPQVAPSRTANDTRVIGVFSRFEEEEKEDEGKHMRRRKFALGCIQFDVPITDDDENVSGGERTKARTRPRRVVINSAGEGGIWVCDQNGDIEIGDLLVSSDTPGAAMRQSVHHRNVHQSTTGHNNTIMAVMNTTIAKATCSCDFSKHGVVDTIDAVDGGGGVGAVRRRHALIGCVYLTG